MEKRIAQLTNLLFASNAETQRLKERLASQRALVTKAERSHKSVEADKGKLELAYYDLYFDRLSEKQLFKERIASIRSAISLLSGIGNEEVLVLLDQVLAETRIEIPTLKPYPILRVDLGLSDGCSDYCKSHRRGMTSRMGNAFHGTRVNAILDLSHFADAKAYLESVHSKSKGNVVREARRASSRGLVCRTFNPFDRVDDIGAILNSKPERQAGALRPPYDQGVEVFLKYVEENHPNRSPSCQQHHNTCHGIFELGDAGHLLGFVMVERHGQFGHYRHIMGHGDWLKEGIMFQLHFAVVDWAYTNQQGLTLLSYAQWTDLPDTVDTRPGLTRWKKKTLFKPMCLIETLHGTPEELRAEVIENAKNKTFPVYVLEDAQSVACLYSAALMGQRDVIHVVQQGIEDVTLVDHDAEMMAEMRKAYPQNWNYHVGDAFEFVRAARDARKRFDVLILDPWVYLEGANVAMTKALVGIANQYILISLTDIHFFRQNHLKPVAKDVFRYFHALDERIVAAEVELSTRAFGGLYWCVLKLSGAMQ